MRRHSPVYVYKNHNVDSSQLTLLFGTVLARIMLIFVLLCMMLGEKVQTHIYTTASDVGWNLKDGDEDKETII